MQYKLVTIDLDDTLLKHDLTISRRNIEAIRAAVGQGVKVTLASGRATPSVAHYLDMLELDLPIITYQGARIVDLKKGSTMYERELEKAQALPIIRFAEQNDIYCHIYVDDVIYIKEMNKWAQLYHSLAQNVPMKAVGRLSEFIDTCTTKIVFIDEHEKLLEIKPEVERIAGEDINVFISKPNYLEFTSKYATKGEAVKLLGQHFGIEREAIMAIGDTYNDISMIEYAGIGVCMQNGPEDVRTLADDVTLSNEEDGVAHAIEKYILQQG